MLALIDPLVSIGGALGGFAVGLTGMGGGALLTPMLVLFFNVPASAAVGTDLVASLMMKPVSGAVHLQSRTVRLDIVKWLCVGSVPGALTGSVIAGGMSKGVRDAVITRGIGVALLVAATTMVVRAIRARNNEAPVLAAEAPLRRIPTSILGLVGGLLVGLTSVGSGSLMIVVLTMLYPALTSGQLVGTDLVQAIPLVAAASLGHLLLGDVRLGLTASLVIGAIPGAYVGARLSSSRASRIVKPALVVLLLASAARLLTS